MQTSAIKTENEDCKLYDKRKDFMQEYVRHIIEGINVFMRDSQLEDCHPDEMVSIAQHIVQNKVTEKAYYDSFLAADEITKLKKEIRQRAEFITRLQGITN